MDSWALGGHPIRYRMSVGNFCKVSTYSILSYLIFSYKYEYEYEYEGFSASIYIVYEIVQR